MYCRDKEYNKELAVGIYPNTKLIWEPLEQHRLTTYIQNEGNSSASGKIMSPQML